MNYYLVISFLKLQGKKNTAILIVRNRQELYGDFAKNYQTHRKPLNGSQDEM